MPINYLAKLTSPQRTARSNRHLGVTLAGVAGALNAGGYLAVGQYTSHMTGMLSSAADDLVLGRLVPAFAALFMLIAFAWGAAGTAIIVNYAKRNHLRYIYTPVLLLEAVLLLIFGLIGSKLQQHAVVTVSLTTVFLCYLMGLQNALITKISNAEIRTTHVTGLVTDIGIELGKLIYWNRQGSQVPRDEEVGANMTKLRLHGMLVTAFFVGGVMGALGFKHLGFISALPLALALVILSLAPNLKQQLKQGV
ncbi:MULTISPECIES: YoaK family protein [unclassified Undibacterium]|uniref:YoaK family protein n=1 Tax=unclassified Undibacterium TaxID=2630295 RepID=UPI002AC94259|nr:MULTISPECIES: YoaK family protein [unclassified Undibacterium]MEB0139779.1 YoaK family protein [Undibacterium sp. CCC2.1]MEB0170513.1 YoaK family protein [Undibacterium sp. CCC1.1]MEB0174454.1 YoaK family protein [Undibacterium sp. CCC3.4]MEB0213749.1 YoaK family protein [Undibacterium sp. 5I2]WPX43913.1 YoaK family protein [Undibacterium sp. CCC3.4]